ncbi:MAG: ferrous iron transport protein B [bacterium]|nr:ferrous iron transport protein B [bacterium]
MSNSFPTIVLVGNPNVGKSVIFQQLTGKYVTVSNYPGTTVEISQGSGKIGGKKYRVIDTPGISSLIPKSEDERVTRDVLITESVHSIVQIADSKNLQRTLHLTLQLLELDIPLILVLNMADEAKERGIQINIARLRSILNIPVVETVAVTGQGINELRAQIAGCGMQKNIGEPSLLNYSEIIESAITKIQQFFPTELPGKRSLATMLLSGDESGRTAGGREQVAKNKIPEINQIITATQHKFAKPIAMIISEKQMVAAQYITEKVSTFPKQSQPGLREKISQLTLHPISGGVIALLVLYFMYQFVGRFAAGIGVDFLSNTIFGKLINPVMTQLVQALIPINFFQRLLIGQYGVITMAITYAFAIIFPIVTAFFIFFGILEDSGYLPRLAVMSDRLFQRIGLHGKAVLPMVLGLGCGTMAVLTSRILDTKKERLITILLLGLAIPCSAQLGIILAMLGALSWAAMAIWFLAIVISLCFVGYLADKFIPGKKSSFLMELPPLRIPQVKNILVKTGARIKWYLREAVPLFILGTLLLFFLNEFGLLYWIERFASPVIVHFLGLPEKVTESFLIGFLRRDYGAAGLLVMAQHGLLNSRQIIVSIVAITLFIPCIAQFLVTVKEQGVTIALIILGLVMGYAIVFSGILNGILTLLGWSWLVRI